MTLENQGGSVSHTAEPFVPCLGPNCKTKIKNTPLCSECIDKLPRTLRRQLDDVIEQIEAEKLSPNDDSVTMLVTSCIAELQQQRVEQTELRRQKRKSVR